MTLGQLKALLREGVEPEQLPGAEYIGSGIDRQAYRVGPFVVKSAPVVMNDHSPYHLARMRELGVRPAPQITVGDYVIQLFYTPLVDDAREVYERSPGFTQRLSGEVILDTHAGNVGLDRRGRYVAFDW